MITSGFFNSVGGDRLYNAEDMTDYFEGLITDGVYEAVGDALIVLAAGNGMGVTVGTGRAIVGMHWLKNTEVLPLTLSAADVQYERIDLIVMRCDETESGRAVTIEIKEGTPAATPAAPVLERSETVTELMLAKIRVKKGVTTIYQANITDTRGSTFCGWVTGLIKQVDTSELFLQYQDACERMYASMREYFAARQAEFDAWFEKLTDQLTVDTTLKEYNNSYVVNTKTYWHYIGIPEYEYGDILLVSIDGVLLTKGVNYDVAVQSGEKAQIILYREDENGEFVEYDPDYRLSFTVIKSVIGTGGSTAAIANAAVIAAAVDTDPAAVQGTATKEEI